MVCSFVLVLKNLQFYSASVLDCSTLWSITCTAQKSSQVYTQEGFQIKNGTVCVLFALGCDTLYFQCFLGLKSPTHRTQTSSTIIYSLPFSTMFTKVIWILIRMTIIHLLMPLAWLVCNDTFWRSSQVFYYLEWYYYVNFVLFLQHKFASIFSKASNYVTTIEQKFQPFLDNIILRYYIFLLFSVYTVFYWFIYFPIFNIVSF